MNEWLRSCCDVAGWIWSAHSPIEGSSLLTAVSCNSSCHSRWTKGDGTQSQPGLWPATSQILSLENWKYQASPCRLICPAHSASLLLRGAWVWSAPFGYPVKQRNSPSNLETSRGNVSTARSCTLDPAHWILHTGSSTLGPIRRESGEAMWPREKGEGNREAKRDRGRDRDGDRETLSPTDIPAPPEFC